MINKHFGILHYLTTTTTPYSFYQGLPSSLNYP